MSRSYLYPLLLLVMALLVVSCQWQTGAEGDLPDPAATLTEGVSPLVQGERQSVTPIAAGATIAGESAAVANPPVSVFDIPRGEMVNLLPTVTPTPDRIMLPIADPVTVVTPTPTAVVVEPTVEPEIYPMATPYSGQPLAYTGISYTKRTGAGFGDFPFNNLSPCLCRSLQNEAACSHEIEEYQLSAHTDGVVRGDQCLSIDLQDGRVAVFTDHIDGMSTVGYEYLEPLPVVNYHLFRVGYWEWSDYLLLDSDTGAVASLPGVPEFSPDNRHFAVAGRGMYSVQIWSMAEDGPHFELGWQFEQLSHELEYSTPDIAWTSAERFQIHLPAPECCPDPPPAPEDVTVALETEGWVVYHDGKPIMQPVVDYKTIKVANLPGGSKEVLATLHTGEPVYSDQSYLFTAVPAEVEGATYFHIRQHYVLGEDPSYFPLEQQMAEYLKFQVTKRATVYVGLDAVIDDAPDWLQEGWQRAPLALETNDIPLRFYRRQYEAGDWVALVDKWMTKGRVPSQFVVIVAPAGDG